MKALKEILITDIKISIRCTESIVFGIIFPMAVAVLIGIIYGNTPAFDGADYTFVQQSFGAVTSIGICATGLMGLPITFADYRHKKVLRRFQVTPVSPGLLLLSQFVLAFILSVISAGMVSLVFTLFFSYRMPGSLLAFMGSYLLVAAAIYALGMTIASISPNIKTANLLCTLLYFPMIFLSGATVPIEIMPKGMQTALQVLPLTQGIRLLKGSSLGLPAGNLFLPLAVLIGIAVIGTGLSLKFFRWE